MAASTLVAAGIFLSRIIGFVRLRVTAHYFGTSVYASVITAGLRMPNFLQNLLGEGTLSASFIPVYSELLEEGREEEAGRMAGAVFALLLALAGVLTLGGIALAPVLVAVFLPGFDGLARDLAIDLTRITFAMTGFLVLSAWALGILNSHRKFFVPYFAPVLWNAAIIGALVAFGERLELRDLVIAAGWGALLGGILQFGIQLPFVLRLERQLKIRWNTRLEPVREAVRNAGPAIMGRGVVQLSSYVDMVLASLLVERAIAILGYATTLYVLPVSLFGMSVAAAELPDLARQRAEGAEILARRTSAALQRIAFYVVPSFVAFVLLGDLIVAALYQTGEFGRASTLVTYFALAAYSIGLLASTGTRLLSSTYFALRDTKTPAKYATLRVVTAAALGFLLMVQFERVELFGVGLGPGVFGGVRVGDIPLGVVGLALGSGIAAWMEWGMLRHTLRKRIGTVGAGAAPLARMFVAALVGAGVGWGLRWLLPEMHPILEAAVVLGGFGVTYLAVAALLGIDEIQGVARRVRGALGR